VAASAVTASNKRASSPARACRETDLTKAASGTAAARTAASETKRCSRAAMAAASSSGATSGPCARRSSSAHYTLFDCIY